MSIKQESITVIVPIYNIEKYLERCVDNKPENILLSRTYVKIIKKD